MFQRCGETTLDGWMMDLGIEHHDKSHWKFELNHDFHHMENGEETILLVAVGLSNVSKNKRDSEHLHY